MPIANYASSIKTFLQPNYLYGSVRYPFKGAYNLFDVYLNEALLATDGINTATTFGNLSSDIIKWIGGVLAPNGYIYGIPFDSTSVLKIDPLTDTATTFGSLSGQFKWQGGVLAPNGYIYGIPRSSTSVLKIQTNIYSRIDQKLLSAYSNKF